MTWPDSVYLDFVHPIGFRASNRVESSGALEICNREGLLLEHAVLVGGEYVRWQPTGRSFSARPKLWLHLELSVRTFSAPAKPMIDIPLNTSFDTDNITGNSDALFPAPL
jgi:hypothetical protein